MQAIGIEAKLTLSGGIPLECSRVLYVYCLDRPNICKSFNEQCRKASSSSNECWNSFSYKGLWWMLLEALLRLPTKTPNDTTTFYRGTHYVSLSDVVYKSTILFGQFLSASESVNVAKNFARRHGIVFKLRDVPYSAYRHLGPHSRRPDHCEVLLMPFCVFRVVGEDYSVDSTRTVVALEYERCLLDEPDVRRRIQERFPDCPGGLPVRLDL